MSFKLSYSAHLKVFGTIIDLENGNPMKGVWVKSFKNGICSDSMCTSSNGKYKLNLDNNDQYIIKFIKGGYVSKCFIVDTYGGWAPHGGGAFSGKDPTKVDRSAAYYARYVAKSLVHHKIADRALV